MPESASGAASAIWSPTSSGCGSRVEVHFAGVQDRDSATLVLDRITPRFPFIERFFANDGYRGPRSADAAPRPVAIIKRTNPGFVIQPKRGVWVNWGFA